MEIRQLRYFLSIARCGSFSRASAELNIAQPALSSQIAALEAEFEAQLFVRHSRGVELTEAGRVLALRVEPVLVDLDAVREEIRSFGKVTTFAIRLGLPTTVTGVVTIPLISALAERHPEVVLHIVEGLSGHLEKWLKQGDIDIAFLFDKGGTGSIEFGTENLVLIGRPSADLGSGKTVEFRDVADLPFVHTTRAHQLRRMIDNYSMELRTPLNIVSEIDSLAQIKAFVFNTYAYTVMPEAIARQWKNSEISYWRFTDPRLVIWHHAIPSAKFQRYPRSDAVLETISTVVRGLIVSGEWPGTTLGSSEDGTKIMAGLDGA